MKYNVFKIFTTFMLLSILLITNITVVGDSSLVTTKNPVNINLLSYNGEIITVDDDGDENYSKIQDAIDNASDGDIIKVYSGVYHEFITINKQLTILGIEENENGKPIVNAVGKEFAVTFTADNCIFEGFWVMNTSKGDNTWKYFAGIKILSDNNVLKNNIISNCENGIWIEKSNSNTLDNNNLSFNKVEIYILESCNNTISNNTFSNHNLAIQAWYHSDNNKFLNNKIKGVGFYLWESSNNEIINNKITSNLESSEIGIGLISLCFKNKIIGNIISNMQTGIAFSLSDNNLVSGNNILNNSMFGMQLYQSDKNTIKHNNFINNGFVKSPLPKLIFSQAFFFQSFFNKWYNNYWDDWQRIIPKAIKGKLGKNGLIPWRNFDWLPARDPYDIVI